MAQPIGTLGVIPTLTIGNRVLTDLTTLIVLHAGLNEGGGAAIWSTFRKDFATAGYPVTALMTLNIAAAMVLVRVSEATVLAQFGYGDTDVGLASAAAPTTPKYTGGAVNEHSFAPLTALGVTYYGFPNVPIPAGKYPFVTSSSAATVIKAHFSVFGYES